MEVNVLKLENDVLKISLVKISEEMKIQEANYNFSLKEIKNQFYIELAKKDFKHSENI